jgi:hypothetical protein
MPPGNRRRITDGGTVVIKQPLEWGSLCPLSLAQLLGCVCGISECGREKKQVRTCRGDT